MCSSMQDFATVRWWLCSSLWIVQALAQPTSSKKSYGAWHLLLRQGKDRHGVLNVKTSLFPVECCELQSNYSQLICVSSCKLLWPETSIEKKNI